MLPVAGDLAGDSSSFMEVRFEEGWRPAEGGGTISMPWAGCLRCARCFSSMCSKPSFVKGFGSTSFMPVIH